MDLSLLIAQVPVGEYVSIWKLIPLLILTLIWARLLTWIDKDALAVMLPRVPINIGMIAAGIAGFILFFALPNYLLSLGVLVVFLGGEIGVYLIMRHQKVGLGDLRDQFNNWLRSLRGKTGEIKAPVGDVLLITRAGAPVPAPASEAPERPHYEAIQTVMTEPMRKGADRIDLVPADNSSVVRYMVDGVAYTGATLDKSRAAGGIHYLKQIAGLDLNERRKPQKMPMKVTIDGKRCELEVETAGSTAGEQLRITIDPKKRHELKLAELGLSQQQLSIVQESLADLPGVVLVAAPKGQGLTSTLYGILRAHDAFLTHIHTIEPKPEIDLEGITQNLLPAQPNPVEDAKIIDWVISQEPDVVMAARVENPASAAALAKYAGTGRRIYVGMRAGSTFDALSLWRKLVGDDRLALRNLRLIISGRVVRRLCSACKVGYSPDPPTLRKLGMDPDKIGKLFQARTQPLRDHKGNPVPCEFCNDLAFKGRLGVYEMLVVDDDVRAIFENGGSTNQLRQVFRKQRGKYLQEQALAQVAAGETSVQEVLRVLKSNESAPAPSRSPAA